MKAIEAHPRLDYRLIVSGAHLDDNFGKTLAEIENDGFTIHAQVDIGMKEDDLFATVNAIGSGIISLSQSLRTIKPDILVVYADRFEGFAAVITGTQMNIPTAHIEGGDITEGGALDDSVRHAMTKLSHLHFTTNEMATNRILGMGEEPWRVHTVGFPAIDLIVSGDYASAKELKDEFGIQTNKPIILFTQHSVTTEYNLAAEQIRPSIAALTKLALRKDLEIIVTYPNNDAGGRQIIQEINASKLQNAGIKVFKSLGRYFYHGVLAQNFKQKNKVVCVGNSSSGIKETPAFGCPTVNIGSRQRSRLRGNNIIDVKYDASAIYDAINHAMVNLDFIQQSKDGKNPYGQGNSGSKIAQVLSDIQLDGNLLRKKMTLNGESQRG